jgi:ABC-type phosphate/phosphonate transport system substrate-binding protein
MNKRSIVAVVAATAAAVSLGLAGCSGSPSTASSASSATLPVVKMMVGGIDKQIYLPYQLAESLGYYKKYGVDMQLSTEQNGGVGAEEAMVSGQVDLSGAWYIHSVDFQAKGKKVINLIQLSGAPGERIMCTPKSNVTSGADLKGKTVGVTDLGSGTDELTQFIASKAGVKKTDYQTIAVHAGATAIAALQRGSADCVMTTQPTVGALESQKLATSAIDLASTKGANAALGGAWPAAEGRHGPHRDDALDEHPHRPGCRGQAAEVVRAERHDLQGGLCQGAQGGLRPVPPGRPDARRWTEDGVPNGERDRRRHLQHHVQRHLHQQFRECGAQAAGHHAGDDPRGRQGLIRRR